MSIMRQVLEGALDAVCERGRAYGDPVALCIEVARFMSAELGIEVPPQKVPGLIIGLKRGRLKLAPDHRDSDVDTAGWAAIEAEVVARLGGVALVRADVEWRSVAWAGDAAKGGPINDRAINDGTGAR